MSPETTARYRVLDQIGGGGMGVVYRAQDTQLGRTVALKFLPSALTNDPDSRKRLIHEAQAASALQHDNICTIHDIGETPDGQVFICMDYYEGETLKRRMEAGPIGVSEALGFAIQTARGMDEAHRHAIVHRDIKPSNLLLGKSGQVKIVDFGLAKKPGQTELTRTGTTVGTPAYMSPEHVRGEGVDSRSDVWALGVTLYEMLAGSPPFTGGTPGVIADAVLTREPKALEAIRPDVPPALAAVVRRALAKNRDERYADAGALLEDLLRVQQEISPPGAPVRTPGPIARALRRRAVWIPLVLALVAGLVGIGTAAYRQSQVRWARQQLIPEIQALTTAGRENADTARLHEAFKLALEAERHVPGDAQLAALWPLISGELTITSTPPGARVSRAEYAAADAPWEVVGTTPIEKARIPVGYHRWKFEMEGFEPVLAMSSVGTILPNNLVADSTRTLHRVLDPAGTLPPGMVRVVVNPATIPAGWKAEIKKTQAGTEPKPGALDFVIDRHEVTNAEYKKFVDAGGYQRTEYWKHEFIEDARPIALADALREFVDTTGRPGPATWEAGDYPAGRGDYPVSGISWYEAAAYAEFAGKELPTAGHWRLGSSLIVAVDWLSRPSFAFMGGVANFSGMSPRDTKASPAADAFGTFDMAGNVREWCWNPSDVGRVLRGGAWNDVTYMYGNVSQAPAFDRSPKNGVRCVRYLERSAVPAVAFGPIQTATVRDFSKETPVSDAIFAVYKDQFSYSEKDLEARTEATDDTSPDFVREKVSFTAAYAGDRVLAILFLPKRAVPPYQTVIFFGGSNPEVFATTSDTIVPSGWARGYFSNMVDPLLKNGRAVVWPIYYGTHERNGTGVTPAMTVPTRQHRDAYTEIHVRIGRDFRRTVDYLESRDDIDSSRLAFLGASWGGKVGPVMTAIEPRIKAAVFVLGGLSTTSAARPEALEFNYLPRSRVPTLMLNGRYDMTFPLHSDVQPMFDHLGTPAGQKRLVLYETDHFIPRNELVKETLAWFDQHLGPVTRSPAK